MDGREAAVHIMCVLMTSSGVVAAAANAPETAPIAKSSCNHPELLSTTALQPVSTMALPGVLCSTNVSLNVQER